MSELRNARPAVTVATIVERDGAFLLVEEETRSGGGSISRPDIWNPASRCLPPPFAKRSRRRRGRSSRRRWSASTAGRRPTMRRRSSALRSPPNRARTIRRARSTPGIVRALWLSYDDIVARRAEHRSPLVLRCLDDYRAGRRWPTNLVREV
jgi:hypothetical protein